MFAWQATVQDDAGNAVPLPVVTVYQEDGVTLADIYAEDQVTPLANPFTGELEGFVQFWAEAGAYKIIGANGASETQEWNVFLDTPLTDAVAAAEAAAASAAASAAVLAGFAIPDWGTFTTDSALSNGRGPYALPYDPGNVAYVDLTVGGIPQVPTADFTLTYSGSVAQILLAFDMPSGAVCNYRLQRPLPYDTEGAGGTAADTLAYRNEAEVFAQEAEAARDATISAANLAGVYTSATLDAAVALGVAALSVGDVFAASGSDVNFYGIYRIDTGPVATEFARVPTLKFVQDQTKLNGPRNIVERRLHTSTTDRQTSVGIDANRQPIVPFGPRGFATPAITRALHEVVSGGLAEGVVLRDANGNIIQVGARNPPEMEVVFSSGYIDVYIRQDSGTYLNWRIIHHVYPARYGDVWRTYFVYEAVRSGSGAYTRGRMLFDGGEVEMAVAIVGKRELIGGITHGGEKVQSIYVLVDGAFIDHTVAKTIECDKLEIFQNTFMYEPNNVGDATDWPATEGELVHVMTAWRRHVFEGRKLRLRTFVEHVVDGFTIEHGYFGMAPILRVDGIDLVANTATWSPKFEFVDASSTGFTSPYTTAEVAKVWGPKYGVEVTPVAGWDQPGRNMWVRNNEPARIKIYPDFFTGDVTSAAAPWDVETEIHLSIRAD